MVRALGHLTEPELGRLLNAADASLRDRALLELIVGSGLTSGELAVLKRDDVHQEKLQLRGTKPRTAILTHQAAFHLARYLNERRDTVAWLFVRSDRAASASNIRSHLTARSIQRLLERYARIAGLTTRITPGVLRRLFAHGAYSRGRSTSEVQVTLGHKHRATTERLLQVR